MKRLAFVMVFVLLTFCFAFTSEAGVWSANYINSPDDSVVYDRYSWDWWNHLAITWNDTQITVSAIQMDPDGRPNLYYWGDIYAAGYPTYMYLYYSYNGYVWYGPITYVYY